MPSAPSAGRPGLVLGLCVAIGFTTLLDQAVFTLAVPSLQAGLHASPIQLQLLVATYSIAFGVALVPGGRLGDRWGRRPLFLAGLCVFAAFSLLGGLASDPATVILARLLQGLGAGAINTQVMGLIQDLFQGQDRARALGRYFMAGGLAAAVGPLLGGLALSLAPPQIGWRLLLLANVPFALAVLGLALRHLPRTAAGGGSVSLDLAGLLLLTACALSLMLATLAGGTGLPAPAWLGLAGIALVLFLAWEGRLRRGDRNPILADNLVRAPGYLLGTAVAMFQFAAGMTLGAVAALFFLQALGVPAHLYALLGLPAAVAMVCAAPASWRFLARFGRNGVVLAIAVYLATLVLEAAAVAWWRPAAVLTVHALGGLVQGLASGLIHAPNQALTLAEADAGENRGVAAGFLQLSQRLACAVGMSAGAGLFLRHGPPRDAYATALLLVMALTAAALLAAGADALRRRQLRLAPSFGRPA